MTPEQQAWVDAEVEKDRQERAAKMWTKPGEKPAPSRNSFHRAVTPEELAELRSMGEQAVARMAGTACKGDRANLSDCTSAVESGCDRRDHNSCPRRIIAHENRLQRANAEGGRTGYDSFLAQGIPRPIARLLAVDRQRNTKSMQLADDWWRTSPRPRVLVLAGDSGIGKSFAAAHVVARFGGMFVPVQDLVTRKYEPDYIASLRVPAILALDDLGQESLDDHDRNRSAIASLICNRVDAGVFTVLPLMIGIAELRPRYGDAVAERIKRLGRVGEIEDVSQRRLSDWQDIDEPERGESE